jgi:hypothetical protein
MVGLWKQNRKAAVAGLAACLSMAFASASSGPVLSALAGIGALLMWPYRQRMKIVRWVGVLGYIALDLVMKAPAYYLIARIDVASGSTGWHRARLIEASIEHISEWWVGGTDYTLHWMPTGVSWNPDHTDITNHYLHLGVIGGLPLTLLFIAILAKGFSFVGQTLRQSDDLPVESRFFLWAIGASLFAQAATCISVAYFDQSFIFLYLILAAIGSLAPIPSAAEVRKGRRPLKFGLKHRSRSVNPALRNEDDMPETQPKGPLSRSGPRPKTKIPKIRKLIRNR